MNEHHSIFVFRLRVSGQSPVSHSHCLYSILGPLYISIGLNCLYFLLFKDFIYLFLERRKGREKERERNINVWLPLTGPHQGPGPQPRQVPWLGIEPVTLWFTGWRSIHWATPARAWFVFFLHHILPNKVFIEKLNIRESSNSKKILHFDIHDRNCRSLSKTRFRLSWSRERVTRRVETEPLTQCQDLIECE